MEKELRDDLYLLFTGERVNVELVFADTDDYGVIITCRLRPWKNQPHDGDMILAGGECVDDALLYACRSLMAGEWLPLEWSQRARVPGPYTKIISGNTNSNASRRSRLLSNELFTTNVIEGVSTPINGSHSPSQEQLGQSDIKLLKRGSRP